MIRWLTRVAVVASATLQLACQTPAAQTEVPALLIDPTPASREELRVSVALLLGVPTVTLADDALTTSSVLLIEHYAPKDARGLPLTGRDFGRPEQFHLLRRGAACLLEDARSVRRIELTQSRCRAEPAP